MTQFFLRISQIAAVALALTVFVVLAAFVLALAAAVGGSQAIIHDIVLEPPGWLIITWLVLIGIIVAGALGAAICDRLETTD